MVESLDVVVNKDVVVRIVLQQERRVECDKGYERSAGSRGGKLTRRILPLELNVGKHVPELRNSRKGLEHMGSKRRLL